MQCLILAGGLGTRLHQLTKDIPKALVPAAGQPFADYQLRDLSAKGVTNIVYCIGHYGQQIRDYVDDGSRWKLRARYVDEGENLLGTGGAIRKAYDAGVLEPYFFVIYGDSFLPVAFAPVMDAAIAKKSLVTMTVLKNLGAWDQSNCHFRDGIVTLYSKRPDIRKREQFEYIDYGLAVWNRDAVKEIAANIKQDLADFYQHLSERGQLAGYEVSERFYEVGSLEGLENFEKFVRC